MEGLEVISVGIIFIYSSAVLSNRFKVANGSIDTNTN